MNRTRIGAIALLFTSGLATGCAPQNDGNIDQNAGKVMTQDEARTAVSKTHGSTIGVCTAIGYDSDSDGVNDVFAYVIGQDADADLLAVIPTDAVDIYSTGQYGCVFDDLNGFIEIPTDADIGADCSDTDAMIGSASVATYIDADGDLDGDSGAAAVMVCSSLPSGYSLTNTDCDDTDAAINPAATEDCNGVDDNCAGGIDDGLTFTDYYIDADSDGDGAGTAMSECADPGMGYSVNGMDCDDTNSAINLAATEVCNGVDDNCDTVIDTDATDQSTWYVDGDEDLYGDPAMFELACDQPLGYVADNTDCADSNAAINPDMVEVLSNGLDDDCDAATSDVPPTANSDVCITGDATTVGSDTFELFATDYTLDWWELLSTGVSGSGTVCSTEDLVEGNEFKVNGQEASSLYWLVMRSDASVPNHIGVLSVRGVNYNIASQDPGDSVWTVTDGLTWKLEPWSFSGVAPWDGRDLIFVVPAP